MGRAEVLLFSPSLRRDQYCGSATGESGYGLRSIVSPALRRGLQECGLSTCEYMW